MSEWDSAAEIAGGGAERAGQRRGGTPGPAANVGHISNNRGQRASFAHSAVQSGDAHAGRTRMRMYASAPLKPLTYANQQTL